MDEKEIMKIVEMFDQILPKFPDGRINYSDSDAAAVIIIFAKYKNEILLMKRSEKVREHRGKWDVVAGYIDEIKPIREKVLKEIKEETGMEEDNILSMHIGEGYKSVEEKINKTWFVLPVLVELKSKPEIKLDWEHTECKWIEQKELKNFDISPNLSKVWNMLKL